MIMDGVMRTQSQFKISGWLLPCGKWNECNPWEHIKRAKEYQYVIELKEKNEKLRLFWNNPDDELLRSELAKIGMIKVCYYQIDADNINMNQLKTLQNIYTVCPLDQDIEFIGRIKLKLQIRLLLKIKDPERLNQLY